MTWTLRCQARQVLVLGVSAETCISVLPLLCSFKCPWCLPGVPAPLAFESSLPHHSSVIFLPKASIRTNVSAFVTDGCFQWRTRILNISQRLLLEAHLRGRLAAPRNTGKTEATVTHGAMRQSQVMTVRPPAPRWFLS